SKREKIQELKDLLRDLEAFFKKIGDQLQNDQNKLTAFKMNEAIKDGRYPESKYPPKDLEMMRSLISNYEPLSDEVKKNLLHNIRFLREIKDASQERIYESIRKIRIINVNIVYDDIKKDIEITKNQVELLADITKAF